MAHYVAFVPIITILVCLGFPFTSGYHQPSRTHTRTHYTRLTHRERTSVKYSDQSRCVGHSTFFRDGKHISGPPMPSWVRSWLAANTTATAGTHKTWKRKIQKRKCRSAVPRVCVTFAWPIHNNKLIFYIFDARNPHLRLTVDHRPISCVKRPWQHSLNACERTSEQASKRAHFKHEFNEWSNERKITEIDTTARRTLGAIMHLFLKCNALWIDVSVCAVCAWEMDVLSSLRLR